MAYCFISPGGFSSLQNYSYNLTSKNTAPNFFRDRRFSEALQYWRVLECSHRSENTAQERGWWKYQHFYLNNLPSFSPRGIVYKSYTCQSSANTLLRPISIFDMSMCLAALLIAGWDCLIMPYIQTEHLCMLATTGCDWAGLPFRLEVWGLILSPLLVKKQLMLGFWGLGLSKTLPAD